MKYAGSQLSACSWARVFRDDQSKQKMKETTRQSKPLVDLFQANLRTAFLVRTEQTLAFDIKALKCEHYDFFSDSWEVDCARR